MKYERGGERQLYSEQNYNELRARERKREREAAHLRVYAQKERVEDEDMV